MAATECALLGLVNSDPVLMETCVGWRDMNRFACPALHAQPCQPENYTAVYRTGEYDASFAQLLVPLCVDFLPISQA